jgi:hypothetical protein
MTSLINNFLIVRFSIKIPSDEHQMWATANKNIEEQFSIRENWFKYRVNLFEASYISFKFQTIPFKNIFLIFDISDEIFFKKYIKPKFNVVPIFDCNGNWKNTYTEQIQKICTQNVVLSRVDSDDLIDKNYVENINATIAEKNINSQDLMVIAPYGQITDGLHVQETLINVSPFINLYCPTYSGQDVYDKSHILCLQFNHAFCQDARWIQRIHGSNVDNKFREESPGFEETALMLFNRDSNGELEIDKISYPFWNVSPKYQL